MQRRHMRLVTATLLVAGLASVAPQSDAQDVVWGMQSIFTERNVPWGPSAQQFANRVSESSGGQFRIQLYGPNELVRNIDIVDAVARYHIEAAWTNSAFHERDFGSAVNFFHSVPFGPDIGEFRAWKLHGGGDELRERLYNERGITAIDTICVGPETSGWFKTEITSLEQLQGLRMRFLGLGARVLEKFGVRTVLLPWTETYPALAQGVVDAAEISSPMIDIQFGLHEVAKYNYYPGWHQRVSCGELLMNKSAYDALPKAYRGAIKTAAAEQRSSAYHLSETQNWQALTTMRDRHGVNIRRWPDETLKQFEVAWNEVVAEQSAADAWFERVADSYFAFREGYRVWGNAQSFRTTYQNPSATTTSSRSLPLVMAADNTMGQQGFVRIINRSDEHGEVTIHAIDDVGSRRGPIYLSLDAMHTGHFNSGDLERGNLEKGPVRGLWEWHRQLAPRARERPRS